MEIKKGVVGEMGCVGFEGEVKFIEEREELNFGFYLFVVRFWVGNSIFLSFL